MQTVRYPGWRTMTSAQRRNAKMAAIFERARLAGVFDSPKDGTPASFHYQEWRHGGWYVCNVRYQSGAVGCVSSNYDDGKWRIVCDPRPFEEQPTFATRDDAARAEWLLANSSVAA